MHARAHIFRYVGIYLHALIVLDHVDDVRAVVYWLRRIGMYMAVGGSMGNMKHDQMATEIAIAYENTRTEPETNNNIFHIVFVAVCEHPQHHICTMKIDSGRETKKKKANLK